MDVMVSSRSTKNDGAVEDDGRRLKRLEFEMALEMGEAGGHSFAEILRRAAEIAGADILFVLPATEATSATGLLRLTEDGSSRFVQVRAGDAGLVVLEDEAIDADLLGFARASVDVLERLRADREVIAPLVGGATH